MDTVVDGEVVEVNNEDQFIEAIVPGVLSVFDNGTDEPVLYYKRIDGPLFKLVFEEVIS